MYFNRNIKISLTLCLDKKFEVKYLKLLNIFWNCLHTTNLLSQLNVSLSPVTITMNFWTDVSL